DAPTENLIKGAFVSHADSVWSIDLQENGWEVPEKWFFAIITDLHIGRGYPDYDGPTYEDNGEGEDYYLTERLRKVVDWINKNRNNIDCGGTKCPIQFVAVLGDIADSAEKSEFCKAKKILDGLNDPNGDGDTSDGIPYVIIFGNHDVWPYTEEKEAPSALGQNYFDKIFWSTSSIPCPNATSSKNFQTLQEKFNFKRDGANKDYKNFAFTYGGINFIGLDFNSRTHFPSPFWTTGVYATAEISTSTENWLKDCLKDHTKCLKGYGGNPNIIFSHIPIVKDDLEAFSSKGPCKKWLATPGEVPYCIEYYPGEFDKIEEIIKNSPTKILANFGGHIHGFYDWWHEDWRNANKEYTPIKDIKVLITESLMVGSNEESPKGIIRIVKVLDKDQIDYNNWETTEKEEIKKEFVALNPYMRCEYKRLSEKPCMIFKGHAYSERNPSLLWKVNDKEIGSGEKIECCFPDCFPEVPNDYQVELRAVDKGNPDIFERIVQRIKVELGIIPKLAKVKEEIKEKIEFISLTIGENLIEFGRTVRDKILIITKHSEPTLVGIIDIHFDQATDDIDFTNLIADTDLSKRKSILYMLEWPKEVEKEKTLYIPK
ncbi:MAG: metallophosphoesterase, partial [Patescibacteria group bacterium]|nr:metallophosphoesterase [Patescibacteria group bacterium]